MSRLPGGFRREQRENVTVIYSSALAGLPTPPFDLLTELCRRRAGGGSRGRDTSVVYAECGGERLVVRRYLHGGGLAWLWPPEFPSPKRLFDEIWIAEAARLAGVPVAEVVGGVIEARGASRNRLWLVSRELTGAREALATLTAAQHDRPRKELLLRRLGEMARLLHQARIHHGDLHICNILFRENSGEVKAYILDFDKSRQMTEMSRASRIDNLRRLARSLRKRDPRGELVGPDDWSVFLRVYLNADDICILSDWREATWRSFWWHKLWWRVTGIYR